MNWKEIQKRAGKKSKILERKRKDPRFLAVIGRLVHEGFLKVRDVPPTRARPTVEDALYAGEVEPRVLELLPAIIARRPKLFLQTRPLPADLELVIRDIKRGKPEREFRGIPAEKYAAWEKLVRHHGPEQLSVAKTFRLKKEDLSLLESLKKKWAMSETDVLRKALAFAKENFP